MIHQLPEKFYHLKIIYENVELVYSKQSAELEANAPLILPKEQFWYICELGPG
jgi:hypothetical protein